MSVDGCYDLKNFEYHYTYKVVLYAYYLCVHVN